MKALLLTDNRKFSLTDVPEPEIGPDDVLVRVETCGICGSDVHGYDGSSGRRIPPIIMGHEAAGRVERVGKHVDDLSPGDRVTFDSMVSCGSCYFCHRNQFNLCDNRMVLGVSCGDYRRHGAFAELVAVPRRIVFELPETLPFEHAAMIEPVSVAVHAVSRLPIAPDGTDQAIVVGCGMIGLLVIQALRHAGCARIIAVDVDETRLKLAQHFGAKQILNPNGVDIVTTIHDLTEGRGADVAVEAVGISATVDVAVRSLRKGGSLTLIGNLKPQIDFPLQDVVTRELSVYGTCGCNGEYPECIQLLAERIIDVTSLISQCAPLEDGPEWFGRLYEGEAGLMKVLLQP